MYGYSIASTDKQFQLWTIKDNEYTLNLAQWIIINTKRQLIASIENQWCIKDNQQQNFHSEAQSITLSYNHLFQMNKSISRKDKHG